MDFRDLSYVLAIAKHQNITKAAQSLFVGQPALSKFLKNLEEELQQPLFRRLGHRYVLTYAGERYVERANQIMGLRDDLYEELSDIIKRDVGILKIAVPTMRSTYMLPNTLVPFRKLYPNVKVQIIEGHSSELDQKVLSGEAEVAFYSQSANDINPLLDYEVMAEEELLVCAPKGHSIATCSTIVPESSYPLLKLEHLKNEFMIMMREDQRTRQIVDSYLHHEKIQFANVLYTSNLPALIELVAAGYGLSFIFEPHLRHSRSAAAIDCYSFGSPRATSNFVAAYRKGSYLPSYTRDYMELVRDLN